MYILSKWNFRPGVARGLSKCLNVVKLTLTFTNCMKNMIPSSPVGGLRAILPGWQRWLFLADYETFLHNIPDSSWHLQAEFNQIKRADSLLKLFRSHTQSDEIFSRCGLQCLTAETRNSATDKLSGGHFQVSQQFLQIFILCTSWLELKG